MSNLIIIIIIIFILYYKKITESWLPDANVYDVVGFHYIKLTFLSCPNRVDSLSVTSTVNSYGTYHTLIDVSIDEVAII